jgi:hypothetical protein
MILNTLQDLVMSFIELFAQMAPYLLLGFFSGGCTSCDYSTR